MEEHTNYDVLKVLKRLEIIKSFIILEEYSEIESHLMKLQKIPLGEELIQIVDVLNEKHYSKAISLIEMFIQGKHHLSKYIDVEVEALKNEIKSLELELNKISIEKADLEKLIYEFHVRHNKELGELLLKLLERRKHNAKGTPEQRSADEDFENFHRQFKESQSETVASLTEDELQELKNSYRKASKLCHPDVVRDEQKEIATKLFAELSNAFAKNNLLKVNEIRNNLEKGILFIKKSETINEKHLLRTELERIRVRVQNISDEVILIRKSYAYNTIINIDNWDDYLRKAKKDLQSQSNFFENVA